MLEVIQWMHKKAENKRLFGSNLPTSILDLLRQIDGPLYFLLHVSTWSLRELQWIDILRKRCESNREIPV